MDIPLNEPVRFLAMRWSEDWEFDHPTILLEPVKRYSPNGTPCESMIEDAIDDFLIDETMKDETLTQEFNFRGWSWPYLKRVAEQSLAGKVFPRKHYHAVEEWHEFYCDDNGEIQCKDWAYKGAVE